MGRVTDPYKYTLTLQAYNESYSKVIRGHKYKDKENEKDKNTDEVSETPEIC